MYRTIMFLLFVSLVNLMGCTIMLDTVPHTPSSVTANRAAAPETAPVEIMTDEPETASATPTETASNEPAPNASAAKRPNVRPILPPLRHLPKVDEPKEREPARKIPTIKQPTRIKPKVDAPKPPIKRELPKPRPKFERKDTRYAQGGM